MTELLQNLLPGVPAWIITVIWTVIKILIIIVPVAVGVAFITLAERKLMGYMQVRLGPNRVGPRGLLQPFADAVKLLFKETIVPTKSNKFLFVVAPVLAFAPLATGFAVIPFGDGMTLANLDASVLYVLAVTSMGVYGIIIAGWASNSKYAFLGALRSAAQIVSYEIAMGFALVVVLMAAGSLNFNDIVRAQQGSVLHWYWLPLLPMFLVYFISGVAETNRAPFDVVEGEAELVAGFHVEYSSMTWLIFMLAEYAAMVLVSMLTSVMFLGGWLSPFEGVPLLEGLFAWVPGLVWLLLKTSFFLFVFIWFRTTFPRYRYDQIMRLGWKVFIPLTIVWIVVVGFAVMAHIGPWFDA